MPAVPIGTRSGQRFGVDAVERKRVELAILVADEADFAQQVFLQLREAVTVAACQFVQLRLFAVAGAALQAGVGARLFLAQGVAFDAGIDEIAAGVGQYVFRIGERAFGLVELFAVEVARVFGGQGARGRGAGGLPCNLLVLALHAFGGVDALPDLFDLFLDLAEALQQRAETSDVGGPVFGHQRAHEQVHVFDTLQIQRIEEGLAIGGEVGAA